jgi:hypothetical protein
MPDRPVAVDAWIGQWPTGTQARIRWMTEQVHAADPRIAEAIKWRRLTFTVEADWHHWLCAVAVTERGVNLMFHKGALLEASGRQIIGVAARRASSGRRARPPGRGPAGRAWSGCG